MDVKEAVVVAKAHAAIVFDGEKIRIEDVWFDEEHSEWCVTVGLQRSDTETGLDRFNKRSPARTHDKTIRIGNANKEVRSVRNHDKMPVSP